VLAATLYHGSKFGDRVDRIYHIEREIKDTTDTPRFASYLDIQMKSKYVVNQKLKPIKEIIWEAH
jgi:hypothetical protein